MEFTNLKPVKYGTFTEEKSTGKIREGDAGSGGGAVTRRPVPETQVFAMFYLMNVISGCILSD